MLTKALFAACALLSAGAANAATTFAGTIAFTDTTNNNALTVSSTPNPAPFTSGSLAVGQSVLLPGVLTLMTTFPTSGCVFGCTATDSINLAFTFTSPTGASFDQGGAATETVFQLAGILDSGSIVWANSTNLDGFGFYATQDVSFSNGAKARVNIYNSLLAGTSSSRAAQIDIRIRNLADGSAVPEPATWAMFIGGFGLIGGTMRRRRTSVRFA